MIIVNSFVLSSQIQVLREILLVEGLSSFEFHLKLQMFQVQEVLANEFLFQQFQELLVDLSLIHI